MAEILEEIIGEIEQELLLAQSEVKESDYLALIDDCLDEIAGKDGSVTLPDGRERAVLMQVALIALSAVAEIDEGRPKVQCSECDRSTVLKRSGMECNCGNNVFINVVGEI